MDLFVKRFLSVCLGISLVLASGSLFVFSLKTITATHAETAVNKVLKSGSIGLNKTLPLTANDTAKSGANDENIQAIQAFGLGVRDGIIYFGILYNNNTVGLHKTEFDSQDILHW